MISFSEQFSAARKAQLDNQIEFMRALTAQVVATAEQVLALNINTSRESAARTADTVRRMCAITDPRDLFTLGAQTQEQLSTLYNYSRELFNIAADARVDLTRRMVQQPAPQAATAPEPHAAPEAAAAPVVEVKPEAEAAQAEPKPAPAIAARTKAKPIARAVGKVVYAQASAELPHPAAAPIEEVDAGADGMIEVKPRQARAAKAQRKK